MKIAIDARTIFHPTRRGTGKTLLDLYLHLARQRPQWQFIMLHRGQGVDNPFAGLANVRDARVDIRGDRLDLWQQVRLPLAARAAGADLLHCPANTAPRFALSPVVLTIHDLIPLDQRFAEADSPRWKARVAAAAARARAIVTPSEFSKRQIVEVLGAEPDKITVTPWGADSRCRRVDAPAVLAQTAARFGLDPQRRYVLCFGGAAPRKNTAGVLEAWALLPGSLRRECRLLLVGLHRQAIDGFARQARELGLGESCVLKEFVPEADLPALLSGATALCYASLSEGFGVPILEAFACGTAVITGDKTSLPEVAGDAALLVDAEDPRAIAAALQRVLGDEGLRRDLIARGQARVAKFTWEACAQRTCEAFEAALRAGNEKK